MYGGRNEITERMRANACEYCGQENGYFQVHHIRAMKDIKNGRERWQIHMKARNRKTLVLCVECHNLLHAGKLQDNRYLSKVGSVVL